MDEVLVEAVTGGRELVLVANRARASGEIPLDDLPGIGGRFDLVARFVNAALLTSHGIRDEARATVLFAGADPPVGLRVSGAKATGIGPDERSTAARLTGALDATPMPVWQEVEDGVELREIQPATFVEEAQRPVTLLHETGQPVTEVELDPAGTFLVGDQDGFADEQRGRLAKASDRVVSLGSTPLQADHAAAALHHELDRLG